ncbi:ALDH-like protein [Rhizopus microsporus var. microsporus]|uniref:ALDH-like protein n=2 Tax=Rhizopus microsporus TaxID=58291 RepID=A0A2G4T345_RHIZD|nr:ALDH-like protein [Rhizopus microsporus ATCC 52813]ORE05331.1 ALDH-like protein [Rhizopus microsporus var. microsporus]PHZ15429.1 ALDH-like protein [Rhizopus microsporus ATCC 52813]
MLELSWQDWACVFVGAFVSYHVLNWLTTMPPKKFTVPVPEAANPRWKGKVLENATIRDINDPSNMICYDPSTGYHLDTIPSPTAAKVKELYERTSSAQFEWSKTSFEERRAVLRSLLDFILENQEVICQVGCRDTGKTMIDASLGEVITTCAKLRWTIDNGESVLADDYRSPGLMMMYKHAKIVYQPMGVVAALVSWNYPFHNAIGPVISALMSGNGIIVKCSEYVAWSSRYYESIIKACLAAHGHNPDLVQFVSGFADVGEEIVRCGVKHVTFIGSPGVGKLVQKNAADHLIPCVLELGGKDCAILLKDADLVQAIPVLMRGVFQNCGQNCIGIERIIVAEEIYEKVVDEMNARIGSLRQGSVLTDGEGVDCGAMTMGNQFEKLEGLVQEAVSRGARLLRGGKRYNHPVHKHGQYFEPTLLVDVTPDMAIANNETFAPIMVIMKHRGPDDAVRIANECPYGLGSSVFSADKTLAESMCLRLKVGMANVNDFAVNYLCQGLPFGGVGISGYGRFAGPEGLRGLCVPKAITTDRIPGVKTPIPPILDYPIGSAAKGWTFVESLVNLVYHPEVPAKVRALVGLAKTQL